MNQESHIWTSSSWKRKPITQQAEYSDLQILEEELSKLKNHHPSIITPKEVLKLKETLVDVYNGKGFILQVGDCAERFADCSIDAVRHKVLFYDLLGNLFTKIAKTPAVVIGRMAGQFAKPRSELYETVDGKKVYSFKGENINGYHPNERTPCPKRLTEGHLKSLGVMNHIRQMKHAEITCAHFLEKVKKINQETFKESGDIVQSKVLEEPLPFEEKVKLEREVFVSHEALMLDYEETQVKVEDNKHFNLSAHFLWIGMRTNMVDGAHVEFFRGIENPVGIKLSKEVAATEEDLKKLINMIKMLNPNNEPGKLVLIARFGARYVEATLPKVVKAVLDEGLKVLWVIDAVHGNTQKVGSHKTRKFDDVLEEIVTGIKVFRDFGTKLHGVHLELTPEEVTECLGGSCFEIKEEDLGKNYTSYCDPRLNFSQSIELINTVAQEMSK